MALDGNSKSVSCLGDNDGISEREVGRTVKADELTEQHEIFTTSKLLMSSNLVPTTVIRHNKLFIERMR